VKEQAMGIPVPSSDAAGLDQPDLDLLATAFARRAVVGKHGVLAVGYAHDVAIEMPRQLPSQPAMVFSTLPFCQEAQVADPGASQHQVVMSLTLSGRACGRIRGRAKACWPGSLQEWSRSPLGTAGRRCSGS
jgi:hypothetical protein